MKLNLSSMLEVDGRRVRSVSLRALSLGDMSCLRAAHARMGDEPEFAIAEMIAIATGLPQAAVLALPVDDIVRLMDATAADIDAGVSKIVGAAPALPLSAPVSGRH